MTRRLTWIVAIAVAFCSSERRLLSQCSDWIQQSTSFRPIFQTFGEMCFDKTRGVSVLYAINMEATPDAMETWFWSGESWSKLETEDLPLAPQGFLSDYAITFDSRRNVVVLFGGRDSSSILDDTWEFNGLNWKRVATSGPPISAATGSRMVFDSNRGVVVLMRWNPNLIIWEWDGTIWNQRNPVVSPPYRYGFGVCFDSSRNVTLVFGGEKSPPPYLNDTWEWNGSDWVEKLPVHSPPGRRLASMVFDDVREKAVLFGGEIAGGADLGDTWEWDGNDWTEVSPSVSPPARSDYATAFDSDRGKTVIYWRGHQPPGAPIEVWEYPADSRPVVRADPKSQVACLGGSATLTAEFFSESPVTLQWRRNESSIPAANSETLLIDDIDFGDVGTYDLVATNDCGSTTTSSATLLVCSGPGGCPSPVDVNGDGVVDGLDIARIVDVLLGY